MVFDCSCCFFLQQSWPSVVPDVSVGHSVQNESPHFYSILPPQRNSKGKVKYLIWATFSKFSFYFFTETRPIWLSQVARSSDFMSTSMRLWMTPTWATQSSGQTAAMALSTSSPRTRKNWPSAGANAKATARPWPIRRWRELWETTAALVRSWKWDASLRTSSTQTSCTGSALHRCPCACPATLHQRRSMPGSKPQLNRATAAQQRQTGTAGTGTTSCRKTTTWPLASSHTAWPNSELNTEEEHLWKMETLSKDFNFSWQSLHVITS